MTRYAANTEVSSDRSLIEIQRTLIRYGAFAYAYSWDGERNLAMISFEMVGKGYRMVVPLPDKNARKFTHTPDRGKLRSPQAAEAAWEQATRQRWRALALWIKAVLEAAESEITTLEDALQPFILLPSGETVGEWMKPQTELAYLHGKMPVLLPMLEDKG